MSETAHGNTWPVINTTFDNLTLTNNSSLNVTLHWTPTAIFDTIFVCTGFLGNAILLLLLASDCQLCTPFNMHVMSQACANLVDLPAIPFDLRTAMADGVWTAGEVSCSAYPYFVWVASVFFTKKARMRNNRAVVVPRDAAARQAPNAPQGQLRAGHLSDVAANRSAGQAPGSRPVRHGRSKCSGLALLAIFSLCACVSWLPMFACFFLIILMPELPVPEYVWNYSTTVVTIQPSADPVIFILAVGSLRKAARWLPSRIKGRVRRQGTSLLLFAAMLKGAL
ncbi:hypothetical protein BV898_19296 [Hypsibius exemplaris]|uniref:G-protein coupled receptors family 1 profile domain-containing protein n=1 Tax=Hypsibius exemplaris TaxID=2072580 RepID=A0A9X6RPG8_HYPEX|nr:hypothetical protein BV898_19296 [Hypsibius exemplaris]